MEEMIKELNEFLADLNVFYRKLQNYHWNIMGKDFFVIHGKLEEYYDDVNKQIDEIAEHILMMGYEPLGTLKDYLAFSKIEEAENKKVIDTVVYENVIEGFTVLLQKANNIKKRADEHNHYATSSLMDDYIIEYTKKLWMLKTTISK